MNEETTHGKSRVFYAIHMLSSRILFTILRKKQQHLVLNKYITYLEIFPRIVQFHFFLEFLFCFLYCGLSQQCAVFFHQNYNKSLLSYNFMNVGAQFLISRKVLIEAPRLSTRSHNDTPRTGCIRSSSVRLWKADTKLDTLLPTINIFGVSLTRLSLDVRIFLFKMMPVDGSFFSHVYVRAIDVFPRWAFARSKLWRLRRSCRPNEDRIAPGSSSRVLTKVHSIRFDW